MCAARRVSNTRGGDARAPPPPRSSHHASHPPPLPRPTLQVEEEAIDLTCKPEFTEVNEGTTALRMLLLVEQT